MSHGQTQSSGFKKHTQDHKTGSHITQEGLTAAVTATRSERWQPSTDRLRRSEMLVPGARFERYNSIQHQDPGLTGDQNAFATPRRLMNPTGVHAKRRLCSAFTAPKNSANLFRAPEAC